MAPRVVPGRVNLLLGVDPSAEPQGSQRVPNHPNQDLSFVRLHRVAPASDSVKSVLAKQSGGSFENRPCRIAEALPIFVKRW